MCDILSTAIFIQILMVWVVGRDNQAYRLLESLTDPVLKLARKVTPPTGMMDFSPVIAMFALEFLKNIWIGLISLL